MPSRTRLLIVSNVKLAIMVKLATTLATSHGSHCILENKQFAAVQDQAQADPIQDAALLAVSAHETASQHSLAEAAKRASLSHDTP